MDLESIEASLRGVQQQLPTLNAELKVPRERIDDDALENLVSGYALVGQLLAGKSDLFAPGNSSYVLELNNCVLCGTDPHKRREYRKHIAASSRHFYERTDAGIRELMEWYALHRHESIWKRAAGLYIQIVSEPQLFIEGNDRTAALVISYLLAKVGYPPFVLSAENARTYFDLSALAKSMPRNRLSSLFSLPRLQARLAAFFKEQARAGFRPANRADEFTR